MKYQYQRTQGQESTRNGKLIILNNVGKFFIIFYNKNCPLPVSLSVCLSLSLSPSLCLSLPLSPSLSLFLSFSLSSLGWPSKKIKLIKKSNLKMTKNHQKTLLTVTPFLLSVQKSQKFLLLPEDDRIIKEATNRRKDLRNKNWITKGINSKINSFISS